MFCFFERSLNLRALDGIASAKRGRRELCGVTQMTSMAMDNKSQ